MIRPIATASMLGLLAALAPACVTSPEPSADKFREPIPTQDDVKLKEPVGTAAAATQGLRAPLAPNDSSGSKPYATFYKVTRDVFDGVNFGTAYILGAVWIIVHLPPTTLTEREAVWGPASEALSPAAWRFRATEVGDGEFDYALEGRPKASSSDADYKAVLSGKGYAKRDPRHRQGWFELDFDAANKLDPARPRAEQESGKIKVSYKLNAYPTQIVANLHPTRSESWFDITVTTDRSGGGRVDINGRDDTTWLKDTALEDLVMHSRWLATGAGRAEVTVANGDLGPGKSVRVSECWSPTFARTYYTDDATPPLEQPFGEQSACPFQKTEL
jgi:hypothetical protein